MKRILFVSGSLGLGHVTRDIAIARTLRELCPDLEIDWMATPPAKQYLLEHGEKVLPEADKLADITQSAEKVAKGSALDLNYWAFGARKMWAASGRLCMSLMRNGEYDLLVGDEAYDIALQIVELASPPGFPVFILFDFMGLDATTRRPMDHLIALAFNRLWSTKPRSRYQPVFLGEREDIPLRRFYPFGPGRRAWADQHVLVVGHVLDFEPEALTAPSARAELRTRLGYGPEPTIVVAVGGTTVGADLIERCLEAFPAARETAPGLRMRVVCGPRLQLARESLEPGVEILGYVPKLYEHFAACDLAIVQAGGSSTLELTALKRPFLYFPLENHCEQLKHVAPRLRRLGAGVELMLHTTSAQDLARHIRENIGSEVAYKDIPTDGAQRLAQYLVAALEKRS